MNYKDVIFADKKFSFFANGELYWPSKKTLIISDLHFEKGSFFTGSNQYIPPFDTIEASESPSPLTANILSLFIKLLKKVCQNGCAFGTSSQD